MRFNIYKRFQLDILREDGTWVVYRVDAGKRVRMEELVVPPELAADELAVYLDGLFHELAGFGQQVERVPDDNCSADRPS
ncbi:hypothetical protein [Massilia sp.]|uniref:DUF7661 family protein n=1 Tax=Massilia sp. TaxID=1882437 RepID=UPI00289CB2AB|nr:hypothetical protein [Massilia sp.]